MFPQKNLARKGLTYVFPYKLDILGPYRIPWALPRLFKMDSTSARWPI